MKVKCKKCGRSVGVVDGKVAKHRTGRSKPHNVKPVCEGTGK